MTIKFRSKNQLIYPFFYGLPLTRSQSLIINSQQDATEVLQFVIDELKGTSVTASDLFQTPSKSVSLVISASASQLNKTQTC